MSAVLSLSVSLLFAFFLPFPSCATQACIRVSVYICPVCINALGLRETPSRLGLHNNALDLRETPSRLGLHKCPLLGVHRCFISLPVSSELDLDLA